MLYDDFEKALMAEAVQPNMRTKLVAPKPFQAIVEDFLGDEQLVGRSVLDIGPGQCDFLDIAAARGAKTFGIDFDPCVARLGWHRGHSVLTHNLQHGFPNVGRKFDGVFCRASFNLYWFLKDRDKLAQFLQGIASVMHDASWLWIVPWNNPPDGQELSPELEGAVEVWAAAQGLNVTTPSTEQVARYGIGYSIPATRIWTRGTRANRTAQRPAPTAPAAPPPALRVASAAVVTATPEVAVPPELRPVEVLQPLPVDYLLGLFEVLKAHSVEFLTPDDLEFSDIDGSDREKYKLALANEYKQWFAKRRRSTRPAVMLFHDCDAGPSETIELCQREAALGVRATVAVFARHYKGGQVVPYPLDFERLRPLAGPDKHCIAYHANTWELADYDESRLPAVLGEDLDALEQRGFNVRHISAHGGRPAPDGRNNSSFFYPSMTARKLVWTHNGFGLSGSRYSDGNFTTRWVSGDATLDLRSFLLESWTTKQRLLLLLHPQYYFAQSRKLVDRTALALPWVSEYWDLHDQGKSREYWAPLARLLERSQA